MILTGIPVFILLTRLHEVEAQQELMEDLRACMQDAKRCLEGERAPDQTALKHSANRVAHHSPDPAAALISGLVDVKRKVALEEDGKGEEYEDDRAHDGVDDAID